LHRGTAQLIPELQIITVLLQMLEFALGKRDRFFKLKYAEYKKMEL
jgi:hypothetical protein